MAEALQGTRQPDPGGEEEVQEEMVSIWGKGEKWGRHSVSRCSSSLLPLKFPVVLEILTNEIHNGGPKSSWSL